MNFHSATTPSTIAITWVATSPIETKRLPIGKVWAPKGKWPVTAGVKRTGYFIEHVVYRDLDEATDDIFRRIQGGGWTMVTGAPCAGLDLTKLHPRVGENFIDTPTTLFIVDFDGFTPDPGKDLSKPEHFGDPIAETLKARFEAAGLHSLAEATFVLAATASTGFDPNSKGEPARGCARFRFIFETTTSLTLEERGAIAEAMGRLPGFGTLGVDGKPSSKPCVDVDIYALAYNIFTDRPVLPAGVEDPIEHTVWTFDGDEGHERVDAAALMRELGLGGQPGGGSGDPPPPPENQRLLEVAPELRVPLVRQAVAAIRNDLHRDDWVGMAWAIDGAMGGALEAEEIFLEFCDREVDAKGKPLKPTPGEGERVWRTRGKPRPDSAGIGVIMLRLERQGPAEAEAAIAAIRQAQDAFRVAAEAIAPVDLWPSAGTPVLPEGLLPRRIEMFARAAAIVIGADDGAFACAALAAAAGSIDDAIKLFVMPSGKWLEVARIWVALVGDPSTKKSPIISAAIAALRQADTALYRGYLTVKGFWDALPRAEKATTPQPSRERYIIGDTTAEGAQEAFRTETRGLFGVYDELSGWFGAMERYNQKGGSAERSFWIQAYNGGTYPVDRAGRGSFIIENLSLSMIGGVQPDLIRKVVSQSVDDGLVQRLMPIILRQGSPAANDPEAATAMQDFDALISQLLSLRPPAAGPLRFDDGAQRIQAELAIEHDELAKAYERSDRKLSTAFGKQDGVFGRLCVVWHSVDHADQPVLPETVTEDTARRVATFMRQFTRQHLIDFYQGTLDQSDERERLLAVAGYILVKKLTKVANRQVQAAVRSMRGLTTREITPVLEQLEAFGWLFRGAPLRAGSPPQWKVNPAVHELYAERGEREIRRREEIVVRIARSVKEVRRHPLSD